MKKRNWLRGLALAVSMCLLLAGGVALAQGLMLTADPTCFECWAYEGDNFINGDEAQAQPFPMPPDGMVIKLTLTGHHTGPGYRLCPTWTVNGRVISNSLCRIAPPQETLYGVVFAHCPPFAEVIHFWDMPFPVTDAAPVDGLLPYEYGRWSLKMCEEQLPMGAQQADGENCDQVNFLFAEDCAAAQFVPEAGTIALLGSGLAGLAGYATLRLRSLRPHSGQAGQALRWRSRE